MTTKTKKLSAEELAIAKTSIKPIPGAKSTKQQRVRILREKFPDMANKEIAERVGCNPTYVSQVLRGTTSTAIKNRKQRRSSTTTVTAAKAASKNDAQSLLTARRDMVCIVGRIGQCDAKTLLADVIGDAS